MRPTLIWQRILDWSEEKCRYRHFARDEKIPSRPDLLYLVHEGAVRLVGTAQALVPLADAIANPLTGDSDEVILGFVGPGEPFEIVTNFSYTVESIAHVDQTSIVWMYWDELDQWPYFRREVLDAFRYQHQRRLLWLNTLGHRRTIDRLLGLLTLLVEEYGVPCDSGYHLPFPLTHAQIAHAIGATRVTVTRLMGRLRRSGLIDDQFGNRLCLPVEPSSRLQTRPRIRLTQPPPQSKSP